MYRHPRHPSRRLANRSGTPAPKKSTKNKLKKSRERGLSTEDVVRTYTGLDRTIAEEFIEICDSQNNSLCSDASCNSSCQGGGSCNHNNSDTTSQPDKL